MKDPLRQVKITASSKSARKAIAGIEEMFGVEVEKTKSPSRDLKSTIEAAFAKYEAEKRAKKKTKAKLKKIRGVLTDVLEEIGKR